MVPTFNSATTTLPEPWQPEEQPMVTDMTLVVSLAAILGADVVGRTQLPAWMDQPPSVGWPAGMSVPLTYSGIVVGPGSSAPLPGVTVTLVDARSGNVLAWAVTGADGNFTVSANVS